MRTLTFGGHTWEVRNAHVPTTPGPARYSSSESHVRVSDNGLHLSIQKSNTDWYCSEVIVTTPLGFGTYSYDVRTPLVHIKDTAVFGAFLYENDKQEIDIEVSRAMVGNGFVQCAIQPMWKFWKHKKLPIPLDCPTSHSIEWSATHVTFTISHAQTREILATWTCRGGISSPSKARFILNFWLFRGEDPQNAQEVVISSFTFTPTVLTNV